MRVSTSVLLFLSLLPATRPTRAASPPEAINYQGVLRDTDGNPLDGDFDMVFRFFDAESGGSEILIDRHTTADSTPVTVSGGLFDVPLGTGQTADGSGAGVYTSLGEVFRDYADLWLRVEVDGEVLTPLIQVVSAGYSLNAGHLDGLDSQQFLRSDASGTFTGAVLTAAAGTILNVDGAVFLNGALLMDDDGPDGPQVISFYDDGDPGNEFLVWDDSNDRFVFSNDLGVVGGLNLTGGSIGMAQSDGNQSIYFHDDGNPTNESLTWDDANDQFVFSNDLAVAGGVNLSGGSIGMGQSEGNRTIHFYDDGSPTNEFLMWNDANDWFKFSNDLRVGNNLQVEGSELRLHTAGPDGDQSIYFYEDGSPTGEAFRWSNLDDRFVVTDGLHVEGHIRGANGQLRLMPAGGGDGDSSIQFFENGSETGETLRWDDSDDRFAFTDSVSIEDGLFVGSGLITLEGGAPAIFMLGESLSFTTRFDFTDDVHVIGDLSASGTKSFVQNHPDRDDLEVVYVALEGDEATTFTRGFGRLEDGVARVALGETFSLVTNPDIGLSASVTPRGEWSDLYVESLTTQELIVRSRDGSDAAFDYIVFGLRIGYEEFPVLRAKTREAPVPPEGFYDGEYSREPGLRSQDALSRFARMAEEVYGRSPLDLTASRALRAAIGEGDPRDVSRAPLPDPSEPAIAPDPSPPAEEHGESEEGELPAVEPWRTPAARSDFGSGSQPRSETPPQLYPVTDEVSAGDVVVLDPDLPGAMRLGSRPYDATVAGCVSGDPGPTAEPVEADAGRRAPVALSGIVICKVDASYGPIAVGDLLTTSPTPGHAMRADGPLLGTILGKAAEPLDVGTGSIRVLVTLR